MTKVAGIRFKPAGKIYDFDSGAFVLKIGDSVIVETEQGLGLGTVTVPPEHYEDPENKKVLKQIFRIATAEDFRKREENKQLEQEAHNFCLDCIRDLDLKMNLFSVESTFDTTKLTFFYTADGRVDFRELVKLLVKEFRIRIEMRQVGIRNQSKQCGGIGRCGREICCSLFINNFDPVSIKMAKEQGLSLNPTKISGLCGRLMCCLTFENNTYINLKSALPKPGKLIETPKGAGRVIRQNVLRGSVSVLLGDQTEIEVSFTQSPCKKSYDK
ncbi:MAG: stage 0 sporulation family protein [Desulfamplus sp.]|nr:stage 0 sporulation family protein [Desulfamplus sp.]